MSSVRDKFTPTRKVLVPLGPLTQQEVILREETREADPYIVGFDSQNRNIARAIYISSQIKPRSQPSQSINRGYRKTKYL